MHDNMISNKIVSNERFLNEMIMLDIASRGKEHPLFYNSYAWYNKDNEYLFYFWKGVKKSDDNQ